MLKRFLTLFTLIALAASLWIANYAYPNIDIQKAFYTAAAIAVIHLLFKNLFEDIIIRRITSPKTRYSFKKTVSIVYLVVLVAVVINIWVESTRLLRDHRRGHSRRPPGPL